MTKVQSSGTRPPASPVHAAPSPAEQFHDVELGDLPPRRASDAPASKPTPSAPAAAAARTASTQAARENERIIDPRALKCTVGATVFGLFVGGIGAGIYALQKAGARAEEGDPCWTDHNGDSHCDDFSSNDTKGGPIAAWLLAAPTVACAVVSIGFALANRWTISRGDLQKREEAAAIKRAQQAANQPARHYNPNAGPSIAQLQAQNLNRFNDQQQINNGGIGSGYLPQPFNP